MNWSISDYLALAAIFISSVTGLVVPFVKYVYKKINDKPILECFLNENAFVFFDTAVAFLLTLTIISKKCDSVIKNIELDIFKGKTKESRIYQMKWRLLYSVNNKTTFSDWGMSSTDRETMTPCPIYLMKNTPISYGINFEDETVSKFFQETIQQPNINYIKDTLLTKLNFEEGNHVFDVIITDINGKKKRFEHNFKLSKNDIDNLKYNATIICENMSKEQHERKPTKSAYVELTKL